MLKIIISLAVFLCIVCPGYARSDSAKRKEYNTVISVHSSNFTVFKLRPFLFYQDLIWFKGLDDRMADQFGLSLEHRLSPNITVGGGYFFWNTVPYFNEIDYSYSIQWQTTGPAIFPPYVRGSRNDYEPGALIYRYGYKMADVYAMYRYNKFRKHKISGGVGMSNTWGTNYYVNFTWYSASENSVKIEMSKKDENYLGAIALVRYDYLLFRNRVSLGLNTKLRKYFGLYSASFEYGIHLGVNL